MVSSLVSVLSSFHLFSTILLSGSPNGVHVVHYLTQGYIADGVLRDYYYVIFWNKCILSMEHLQNKL